MQRLQLGSIYPAALSDTELVKLGGNQDEPREISQMDEIRHMQPGDVMPVLVVPPQALQSPGQGAGQATQPDQPKQGKKSKRERAKGLLSSFTGRSVSWVAFTSICLLTLSYAVHLGPSGLTCLRFSEVAETAG